MSGINLDAHYTYNNKVDLSNRQIVLNQPINLPRSGFNPQELSQRYAIANQFVNQNIHKEKKHPSSQTATLGIVGLIGALLCYLGIKKL